MDNQNLELAIGKGLGELRLLILEDRPSDARLMQRQLREAEISFISLVVDDEEDFQIALNGFRPEIILADHVLPSYDGMSALQYCQQVCPEVPFIFVSGTIGEERAIDAFRHGATDCVLKDTLSHLPSVVTNAARAVQERKKRLTAEKALAERNELMECLFEAAGVKMAYMDTGFNFIRVNRAYAEVEGRDSGFFVGKNHFDLYPDDENKAIFEKVVDSGEPFYAFEKLFTYARHPERGVTCWDWSLQLVKEPSGTASRVLLTLIDVTERVKARRHLRDVEKRNRHLFDNAPEGIFQTTLDGKLIMANPSLARMAGFDTPTQMIGELENFNDLFTLPREESNGLLQALVAEDEVRNHELEIIRRDGVRMWVLMNVQTYNDKLGNEKGMEGIWTDITARREADFELRKINRVLRVLSGCNEALVRATAADELIDKVCSIIINTGGYPRAWVAYPEGKGASGPTPRQQESDLFGKEQMPGDDDLCMVLSLEVDGTRFGSLHVCPGPEGFDSTEMDLFSELANDMAYGLSALRQREQRLQAEASLREHVHKVRRALNGFIHAIVLTVESRDSYTSGHQQRSAELASAIAIEMELPQDVIEGIHIAGMIHDLGKINIPSEILAKPSTLMDAELEIIKTHSRVGYEILKQIEFPWPVADMVLQHHERSNGSGYPLGLAGDEIMLESRILAVADVVEAMASHRPYRPAMGMDQALAEISDNMGILYDKEVAEACIRLIRDHGFKFSDPSSASRLNPL